MSSLSWSEYAERQREKRWSRRQDEGTPESRHERSSGRDRESSHHHRSSSSSRRSPQSSSSSRRRSSPSGGSGSGSGSGSGRGHSPHNRRPDHYSPPRPPPRRRYPSPPPPRRMRERSPLHYYDPYMYPRPPPPTAERYYPSLAQPPPGGAASDPYAVPPHMRNGLPHLRAPRSPPRAGGGGGLTSYRTPFGAPPSSRSPPRGYGASQLPQMGMVPGAPLPPGAAAAAVAAANHAMAPQTQLYPGMQPTQPQTVLQQQADYYASYPTNIDPYYRYDAESTAILDMKRPQTPSSSSSLEDKTDRDSKRRRKVVDPYDSKTGDKTATATSAGVPTATAYSYSDFYPPPNHTASNPSALAQSYAPYPSHLSLAPPLSIYSPPPPRTGAGGAQGLEHYDASGQMNAARYYYDKASTHSFNEQMVSGKVYT